MVGESVKDLSVGRWSVVDGLSVVAGFKIRRRKTTLHLIGFSANQKWNLSAKQLATRLASPCICEKETFYTVILAIKGTLMQI